MNCIKLVSSLAALVLSSSAFANKICEFNDPISGTTPGCTEQAIAGQGGTIAYDVRKNGVHLMYVQKTTSQSQWCDIDGSDFEYYITGNCENYRVYDGPIVRYVRARRHADAPAMNNADVDQILGDASILLQTDNGSGDMECRVEFKRLGNVVTYEEGTAAINNSADWTALEPGVNLVSDINWCGTLSPTIIGCGDEPGSRVAVEETAVDDVLWAHELGHNYGISHRSGDHLIMNPIILPSGDSVDSAECSKFRGG